ncbi:MAG: hypothetical protein NC200_04140 [Candidatus Gastranaerophilales bacterium]|nr:hypothetical protein [Candidatus Gastranaerophilales bacterium]
MSVHFLPGCYGPDANGGGYVPTTFDRSTFTVFNGVPVLSHEPFSTIGAFNVADWTDPTYYGDNSLRTRNMVANIDVLNGYYDNMYSSSGCGWFNADGSYIA